MSALHWSWLEIAVLAPLIGALWISRFRDPVPAFRWCLGFAGITLVCTIGAWIDFESMSSAVVADDRWDLTHYLFGRPLLVIDELSAQLLPLVALVFFLIRVATARTKMRRFSFAGSLVSESLVLATFAAKEPWLVIALMALSTLPPYLELVARGRPTRVYALHMGLFVLLMIAGQLAVDAEGDRVVHSWGATALLLAAVLLRCGICPVHCWLTDLFEHATFGTALLFVAPLTGAYAAVRLVLPIAPEGILQLMGVLSLVTAVYAAGMAMVQREARRFFAYLFLSHSSLVLVGLELATPMSLTGSLSLWFSVALALGGFGVTLRALEARVGRLSLTDYHGLYEHSPALAVGFLLTGLASVGFPGMLGYVSVDLLVDGAVEANPALGVAAAIAAALNGIAVLRAYFLLFTGTRHTSTISLAISLRERVAVLTLATLLLLGGLIPQVSLTGRYRAAEELLRERAARADQPLPVEEHHHDDGPAH